MYLGVDLGTTNVKALVVDELGRIVSTGAMPVECFRDANGGVEQDIEQIWHATCDAIRTAAGATNAKAIRSIGISSQGGAVQLLDAGEHPVGRVISWLDTRGRPFDIALSEKLGPEFLAEHIGYGSSTMTLGQVLRLQSESPKLLEPPNRLGFVGDVIVGRLCGRRAHDPTSLGIGMLYNPWQDGPDFDILSELGLDSHQLPDLVDPACSAGPLRAEAADATGLKPGIPVSPAIHDQYAASLGAGAVEPGRVVFGSGTAWVLLATTPRLTRPVAAKAFVCRHPVQGLFGQMIPLGTGGSMLDWIVKLLLQDKASPGAIDAIIEDVPPGSFDLQFWPQIHEAGNSHSIGARLDGLAPRHRSPHIIRAVVEGLACELSRHLRILVEAGVAVETLLMCGSAASSRSTPQIVADIAGVPVACVELPDVSAFGAAVLARNLLGDNIGIGEIARRWTPSHRIASPGADAPRYHELFQRYLVPFLPYDEGHRVS